MKIIGTMTVLDETRGAVRLEDVFDTDIDDLWAACTEPERLARWIADVSGDLQPGGELSLLFTSGWAGTGRIEVCDPPRRLRVTTTETGATSEGVVELVLTPRENGTVLAIEERGLPVEQLAEYGAGWQVHVEDLAAHLAGGDRCDIGARWGELIPHYRARLQR